MREILFRGKTDNAEWVHGHYTETLRYNNLHWIWDGKHHKPIAPETLGQYTGITDKSGTKIFEGDIVKVEYTGVSKGVEGIAEVIFKDCQFALVWGWHKEIVCLTHFCNVTFEVIGNIHDNPELLEKEEAK